MTDPTPPPDLEEVKKRHVQGAGGVIGMPRVCMECAQVWPCDAIRIIQPFEEMVHWKNNIIQDNFENAYVEATLLHDAKKEISRLTRELEEANQRAEITDAAVQGVLENFKTCACRDYDHRTKKWGTVCMVHEAVYRELETEREKSRGLREALGCAEAALEQEPYTQQYNYLRSALGIIKIALKSHPASTEEDS